MTKYKQVAQALINNILEGLWPIDSVLPTEKQLCQQFSISRHTAREAMRHVQQSGLVQRKQGSGTKVISNELRNDENQKINSVEDLLEFAERTRFHVISVSSVHVNQVLAKQLHAEEGEEYLLIKGLRISPNETLPLCLSELYLKQQRHLQQKIIADPKQAINAIVEATSLDKVAKIEQQISAISLNDNTAKELQTAKNEAALSVTRRYVERNNQQTILLANSIYPTDRFSYVSTLYPKTNN